MSSSSSRRHQEQEPISFKCSLAVRPPPQINMSQFFWPPPVVKVTPRGRGAEMAHIGLWVMVSLIEGSGRILENQLGGNLVTTAIILEDDPAGSVSGTQHQRTSGGGGSSSRTGGGGGSSRSSGGGSSSSRGSSSRHSHSSRPVKPLYFAFPDLSVVFAGNYYIKMDVHYMEYPEGGGEPENDTVVASFETSHIKVTEWPVATERGSPSERDLLRKLRAAGQIVIPNSPP